MAVGGAVIEVLEMTLRAEGDHPMKPVKVNRIWCVDRQTHQEICVFSQWYPPGAGPKVGESVWWQDGWIFYDQDRRQVKKVGVSYRPKGGE